MQQTPPQEIDLDTPCPCGSGAIYGECCHGNALWVKNEKGEIARAISMSPDMVEMFKELKKLQEEKLGRPLKGDDKLFPEYDPNEYSKIFLGIILGDKESTENEEFPDIPIMSLAQVYAMCHMEGMIVTEENLPKMTTTDREQYMGLLNEFQSFSVPEKVDTLLHAIKRYSPEYEIDRKKCIHLVRSEG